MEHGVLAKGSALYGRKTAHIRLEPLGMGAFPELFPNNSFERNVEFYAAFGGVPYYLEKLSGSKSATVNIREQLFDRRGGLFEEVEFHLRAELREPDVYRSILASMGRGQAKLTDIAAASGIPRQDMDKYLKTLVRLGLVRKVTPVTRPAGKRSLYVIDDNFFSLYFRFFEPFRSELALGDTRVAAEALDRDFSTYVGEKFEDVARAAVLRSPDIIQATKVGKWWGRRGNGGGDGKKEEEMDIVALDEKLGEILFGECKWSNGVDGERLLGRLREKSQYVLWPGKGRDRREKFLLVARSFRNRPTGEDVFSLDAGELEELLG
jgi:AAA+ ATPase superfamily predicted ATPase